MRKSNIKTDDSIPLGMQLDANSAMSHGIMVDMGVHADSRVCDVGKVHLEGAHRAEQETFKFSGYSPDLRT
jgi:hypothetical protein